MAEHRVRYVLHHPVDVLAVALPMLRPLRVLRIFAAGQALLTRGRGLLRTGQAIVLATSLLILIGALAMLDAERSVPDANIVTFSDAVWWALTTVTSVGYGDRYPVSTVGRVVAGALMLVGVSLLGVVTATVAAWLTARTADEDAPPASVASRLRELHTLHQDAVIDDDEYARTKARLLDAV